MVRIGIGPVFFQEYPRFRQPKPVDALLHIAHGKDILSLPRYRPEDTVLHLISVLVLVHHDLPVPPGHLLAKLRGRSVLAAQHLHGVVFLVREIHSVPPHLLCPEPLVEVPCQCQQRPHSGRDDLQIAQQLRLRRLIRRGQLLQCVTALFQHRPRRVLRPGALVPLHHAHPPEGRLHTAHGIPALPGRGRVFPQLRRRFQKPISIGVIQALAVFHILHGAFQPPRPVTGAAHRVLHDRPAVHAVAQPFRQVRPALRSLLQPLVRVGMALQFSVQLRHQRRQRPVIPAEAQRLRQRPAAFVPLLDPLIERLQCILQCPLLQHAGLRLIQDTEVRRQTPPIHRLQQMDMLPQQPCTEAVHRLDVRLIHPEHLLPQVTVLRVLCHPLRQLCSQLCPQFGGSGAGKCDNKEIVYVAVFLR